MDKQMSMSFFTDELEEVKTHKKEFLGKMDQLIPWGEWVAIMDCEKFFEALKNNEALLNEYSAFMEAKDPQNDEAGYAAIIEFAAAKGYTITIEDIAEAKADGRKMDENELTVAQGGAICNENYTTSCSSTFKPKENCWHDDECNHAYHFYKYHEECKTTHTGNECNVADYCLANLRTYR